MGRTRSAGQRQWNDGASDAPPAPATTPSWPWEAVTGWPRPSCFIARIRRRRPDPPPSGTWSVTITKEDGSVTGFSGSVVDGNISYNTPTLPPNYILDSTGGYILDFNGGKLTAP